jgi:circadian clock protein KaiC
VILLDNRVIDQVTTRRLRVVKYRGSAHGTNEYPFLIDEQGISVCRSPRRAGARGVDRARCRPASPAWTTCSASAAIPRLERADLGSRRHRQIDLRGILRRRRLRRGERCLYFAFEESPDQIVRNMRRSASICGSATRQRAC